MVIGGGDANVVHQLPGDFGTIGSDKRDQAVRFLAAHCILGGKLKLFSIFAVTCQISMGHKRHGAEARDARLAVVDRGERAVPFLVGR